MSCKIRVTAWVCAEVFRSSAGRKRVRSADIRGLHDVSTGVDLGHRRKRSGLHAAAEQVMRL